MDPYDYRYIAKVVFHRRLSSIQVSLIYVIVVFFVVVIVAFSIVAFIMFVVVVNKRLLEATVEFLWVNEWCGVVWEVIFVSSPTIVRLPLCCS